MKSKARLAHEEREYNLHKLEEMKIRLENLESYENLKHNHYVTMYDLSKQIISFENELC